MTGQQLAEELDALRWRVAELEATEARQRGAAPERGVSLTLLQGTIDAIHDPVLLVGPDFEVTFMNQAALDANPSGQGTEPVYCYEVSHHRDAPCHGVAGPCPLQQVRESLCAATVEHEHLDRDGHRRWIEISASPILGEDSGLVGMVEAVRDITDRKRTEEALREAHAELERRVQERTAELASANEALLAEIAERKRT